jgi:hypothetical protein
MTNEKDLTIDYSKLRKVKDYLSHCYNLHRDNPDEQIIAISKNYDLFFTSRSNLNRFIRKKLKGSEYHIKTIQSGKAGRQQKHFMLSWNSLRKMCIKRNSFLEDTIELIESSYSKSDQDDLIKRIDILEEKIENVNLGMKAIGPRLSPRGIPLDREHDLAELEASTTLGPYIVLNVLRELNILRYVYGKRKRVLGHKIVKGRSGNNWFVEYTSISIVEGFEKKNHYVKITEKGLIEVTPLVKEKYRLMEHDKRIAKDIDKMSNGESQQQTIYFSNNSDLDKIKGPEDLYTDGQALP